MIKKSGLTEEKMSDKRFRRTEEKIFVAVFEEENFPGVSLISRKTKLSRSTLYRHHRILHNIVFDYEIYVYRKYKKMMKPYLLNRRISLRILYDTMLCFILAEKRIILALTKIKRYVLITNMIKALKERIELAYHFPKGSRKVFKVFTDEVIGIIDMWGESGFSRDKIEEVLDDMMYLTETAGARLSSLKKENKHN